MSKESRSVLVCKACSKEFKVINYEIKQGRKFCSQGCYHQWKREHPEEHPSKSWSKEERLAWGRKASDTIRKNGGRLGPKNGHWKPDIHVERTCLQCGKAFQRPSGGVYCSRKCKDLSQTGVKEGSTTKIFCKTCGKEKIINTYILKKGLGKYCSIKCAVHDPNTRRYGEDHWNWNGGTSNEPYSFDFDEELKELIRKRDNHKCQRCGAPQLEFTKKLAVHHIDYDKKNSDPRNLVTLCTGCNSSVNTKREFWKSWFIEKVVEKEELRWVKS